METVFQNETQKLLHFIESSPSCFHAVDNIKQTLIKENYIELSENQKWHISPGGKYYVTRNLSSIIAFQIPQADFGGFQLICSHTDSPTFKVKETPEIVVDQKYTKLNVEKYGGMILAPWFDRPLSVAGRVMVQTQEGVEQRLAAVGQDLLMIPNVAIHMNRNVNEGYQYNVQKDLCPVFGDADAKGSLYALIAENVGAAADDLLSMDLFLYNRQKGCIFGANGEFIGSPRLDDLQCVYATLQGFLQASPMENAAVFCAFDNEETGSTSRQGAASTFLKDTLYRIHMALGHTAEEYLASIAGSFLVSADNAHAVHPNQPDLADPVNRPMINGGIVIKYNASQKYTTDAVSSAVFQKICQRADVPVQFFTNRSDMAGGSTLGNISNTQVSLRAVDIGLAQLAMHSPYEMAGVKDTWYLVQAAREFYSTTVRFTQEGTVLL